MQSLQSYSTPHVVTILEVSTRRSELLRRLFIHLSALFQVARNIWEKITMTNATELTSWLLRFLLELLSVWNQRPKRPEKTLSLTELAELLEYEEFEDMYSNNLTVSQRRMRKLMHHHVPANPFRATVRLHNNNRKSDSLEIVASKAYTEAVAVTEFYDFTDKYSPASFPSTPFSRAKIMNFSEERTDSLCFAARDILRLEELSASGDEFSRRAALQAQDSGQMAVFDSEQASEGIVLSCGNHCALKIGKALCSSCRSMVPVPTERFIYMEFSVTASSDVIPSLAIGLSPIDCPLNVLVGSWENSLSLFSDGQILVSSRWFSALDVGYKLDGNEHEKMIPTNQTKKAQTHWNGDDDLVDKIEFLGIKFGKSLWNISWASNRNERATPKGSEKAEYKNCLFSAGSTIGLLVYLPESHTDSDIASNNPSAATNAFVDKTPPHTHDCLDIFKHMNTSIDTQSDASAGILKFFPESISTTSTSEIPECVTCYSNNVDEKHDSTSNEFSYGWLSRLFQLNKNSEVSAKNANKTSSVEEGNVENSAKEFESNFEQQNLNAKPNPNTHKNFTAISDLKSQSQSSISALVQWNVNGVPLNFSSTARDTMNDLLALNYPMYPTVSIISEDTKVWCRFGEGDIICKTPSSIGAPPGSKVYCLDGSVLW